MGIDPSVSAMDLVLEEGALGDEAEEDPSGDSVSWFAWSPAPRPDLPRENRSPLSANRDWLRVVVQTPE
jgi:hypothetical protein